MLIFNCGHKISSTEQVDRIVSCEIPDKNIHPHFHSIIVKQNMHGSCENLNPKNVCMVINSDCKNKYPKDYCNNTILGDHSYPLYRQRNNGICVKVRGQMLDNQWVVPYNPYLSAKFDCHINVEVYSSIKIVKYLYKYVYKGHDRINFFNKKMRQTKTSTKSLLTNLLDGYLHMKATRRIFSFSLSEIYPIVCALQLHIEDHQRVTHKNTDGLSAIIKNEI